ncbi:NUDIX domain-containing protein [Candidatus Poribacteria bacterium]|nr:NUDIX domain-containing protein [Candidatus Poribacteria bacterium]
MKNNEYFDIIDNTGKIIGKATRRECHSNKSLAHRVVHVLIFNSKGELFLQKRSLDKDIQPGKWDTSVGGHLDFGESFEKAVYREMKEELGIEGTSVQHLYDYWLRSAVETEFVRTYMCVYDGQITIKTDEISAGCFWRLADIENNLGIGTFTPNFEEEYERYLNYKIHEGQ